MNAYDDFWPNAARRMLEIDGHVVDVEISVSARPTPHLTLLCGAGMASSRIELRAKSAEDLTRVLEELRSCADEVIEMICDRRYAAQVSRARGTRWVGHRHDHDARQQGHPPGQQNSSGPHDELAVSSNAGRFEPPPIELTELDIPFWPEDEVPDDGRSRREVPAGLPRKSYLGKDPRQKEREDAEYLEELERAEADELDAEIRGELLDDADAYAESDEEGWYYDDEDDDDWDGGDYDDDD